MRLASASEQAMTAEVLHRLDGSTLEVGCSSSPTVYAGQHAFCVVVRDITERKLIEVKLERARRGARVGAVEVGIPREHEPRDSHADERRASA